ncbi:uncharacterized protein V1510DRAFT_421778 [Dipodascopsis tothii]|uniref:uncharacterized protein n=1 Tax=Dipodascopsis tothii TaxID=44089 RepID=UPI0034CED361
MALNWVMLSEPGSQLPFVPLPDETVVYESPPRVAFTLGPKDRPASSSSTYPAAQAIPAFSVKSSTGRVFVTSRRLIYIAKASATNRPTVQGNLGGRAGAPPAPPPSARRGFQHQQYAGVGAEQVSSGEFTSFTVPLGNVFDATVRQPWFGPNSWTAVIAAVPDGGIPVYNFGDGRPMCALELSFKDGGTFDFHSAFEGIRERRHERVDHLEQLPQYQPPGGPPPASSSAAPAPAPPVPSDTKPPVDEPPPYDG